MNLLLHETQHTIIKKIPDFTCMRSLTTVTYCFPKQICLHSNCRLVKQIDILEIDLFRKNRQSNSILKKRSINVRTSGTQLAQYHILYDRGNRTITNTYHTIPTVCRTLITLWINFGLIPMKQWGILTIIQFLGLISIKQWRIWT